LTEQSIAQENAAPDQPGYRLPDTLAQRHALREQIQVGLAQLASDGRGHYHPVEPEARRMKVGSTNRYAYNAQAVADAHAGILVACAVVRQETDTGQLVPLIQQASQNLGVTPAPLTLADTGYGAGADLQAAAAAALPVLVPPAQGTPVKDNPYAAQSFHYDESARTVTCPQARQLDYEGQTHKDGVTVQRYRCHVRDCPVRDQCTRDPKGRQFEVRPSTPAVQAMRARLQEPETQARWRQRGQIIEPRFAQLKAHDGFRRWSVRGLAGVRTQWALLCATLNLRVLYRRWQAGLAGAAVITVTPGPRPSRSGSISLRRSTPHQPEADRGGAMFHWLPLLHAA